MTKDDHIQGLLRGKCGGFAAPLAEAYCRADSCNRARLDAAFPDLLTPPPSKTKVILAIEVVAPDDDGIHALTPDEWTQMVGDALRSTLVSSVKIKVGVA